MSWLTNLSILLAVVGVLSVPTLIFGRWRASHAADSIREPSRNGCAARLLLAVEVRADHAGDVVLRSFEAIGAKPSLTIRPEQVCATRGPNLRTWGEILTAWIVPTSDTTVEIRIESCPIVPFTAVDWGRNRANVSKLADEITARTALVDGPTGEPTAGAST